MKRAYWQTGTILRRLLSALVILFLSISLIFVLIRLAPGDPVLKFISPGLSPQLAEHVRSSFGLDRPIFQQYLNYLGSFLRLDLGVSYGYRIPVIEVILAAVPYTAAYALSAFLLQSFLSVLLSVISGKRAGGRFDRAASSASIILYNTPVFLIGIALIYLLSVRLRLFPSSELGAAGLSIQSLNDAADLAAHLVLPVLTLCIPGTAVFYSYLRENMQTVFGRPFIRYLRSSGMNENRIFFRHVLPNSLIPMISVAGVELGILLSGALITEVMFSLPGLGRLTIEAVLARDYPLIQGCAFISGVMMICSNLLGDILKLALDKRFDKGILN